MTTPDEERKAFEAWIDLYYGEKCNNCESGLMWSAWQARAHLAGGSPEAAVLQEKLDEAKANISDLNVLMKSWRERALAAQQGSPVVAEPVTDENCNQRIADMLMQCADMLAAFPEAKPDPRAWSHLLTYAPAQRDAPVVALRIPEGYRIVPDHPTNTMCDADWDVTMSDAHSNGGISCAAWRAMLEAAPQVTLGNGHSGFGWYVHDTEYPEEGAIFIAAAQDAPAPVVAEPAECENCKQLARALGEALEQPTFMGEPVLPTAEDPPCCHMVRGVRKSYCARCQRAAAAQDAPASSLQSGFTDTQRLEWYFSDAPKHGWLETYFDGMVAEWSVDQWRAAIDAALGDQP